MNPPTEQLVRDYLNRVSVAARGKLGAEDRRAFLARTREFIEQNTAALGNASADVPKLLSGLGDPAVLVDRELDRLAAQRDGRGNAAEDRPRPSRAWRRRPGRGTIANRLASRSIVVAPGQLTEFSQLPRAAQQSQARLSEAASAEARSAEARSAEGRSAQARSAQAEAAQANAAGAHAAGAPPNRVSGPHAPPSPHIPQPVTPEAAEELPLTGEIRFQTRPITARRNPGSNLEPKPPRPRRLGGIRRPKPASSGEAAPPEPASSGGPVVESTVSGGPVPRKPPGPAASEAPEAPAVDHSGQPATGSSPPLPADAVKRPDRPEWPSLRFRQPSDPSVPTNGHGHANGEPAASQPPAASGHPAGTGRPAAGGHPAGSAEAGTDREAGADGQQRIGGQRQGSGEPGKRVAPDALPVVPGSAAAGGQGEVDGPAVSDALPVVPGSAAAGGQAAANGPAATASGQAGPDAPPEAPGPNAESGQAGVSGSAVPDAPPGVPGPAAENGSAGGAGGPSGGSGARARGVRANLPRFSGWASGVRASGVRASGVRPRPGGLRAGTPAGAGRLGGARFSGPDSRQGAPAGQPSGDDPRPSQILPPGSLQGVTAVAGKLVREAGVRARRHPLEATAVVLLGLGGLIFPPVWLMGAVVALASRIWDVRDKWIGLALPIFLVIVGMGLDVSLGGVRHGLGGYVREAWIFGGHISRIVALLGAVYLGWRAERGRRAPAVPPWNRRRAG